MRNIALISVFFILTGLSYAQNEPEDYIATFFDLAGQGKIKEAIEIMPANNKFENDTSYASKLLARLEVLRKNSGDYCGYELIEKEEVTESYIIYTYFMKFMNAPQKIQFVFYKPKDAWQVNHISLTNQSRQGASRQFGPRK